MAQVDQDYVIVGKVAGIYGVRGWVKIFSHTDPKENIFEYSPLYLKIEGKWRPVKVIEGRKQGKGLVAHLESFDDREQSRTLMGVEIAISRAQLPALDEGEYYWTDLLGLKVVTETGVELGRVDHLMTTGANDVVVVSGERERLIPFVQGQYIKSIDLTAGVMTVDWDPEF